jgi:hypothetical protein
MRDREREREREWSGEKKMKWQPGRESN